MGRAEDVTGKRRDLWCEAYDRWQGFAAARQPLASPNRNKDGTVPRPAVALSTPVQKERFHERQRLRERFESPSYRTLRIAAERKIGATLDFVDLPPNEQALKAGRPVARLVSLNGSGIEPQGFATGFLVAKDVILTNFHVFQRADDARDCGAQFLYERIERGVREGLIFELDPDRFFLSCARYDYALVAVKPHALNGASLDQFQYLPLIGAKGKIEKGCPVNIIQHPQGQAKQYATVNNVLLDLRDDGFLLYETDTLEGSSGSPVFNQWWETIGLHHCGVPQMEDGKLVKRNGERVALDAEVDEADLIWVANEGVRVSALVDSFRAQRVDTPDAERILQRLVEGTFDILSKIAKQSPLLPANGGKPETMTPLREASMAGTIFQFSGPVSIYVGAGPAVALAGPAPPLPGAAVPPDPAPVLGGAGTLEPTEFLERALRFDENYKSRDKHGYDSQFLDGWDVPAPTLGEKLEAVALKQDGEDTAWVIPYYHYSLVMHGKRRLLIWAASNVDYSEKARAKTKDRKSYGGENWRLDPRIALHAPGLQIENADFYGPARKIDRGHIVRREDACWGATAREAEFGNSDTYHWTNCTPQSEAFNQSGKDGLWGKFEMHIQRESKAVGGRVSVFAGPVFRTRDPERGYDERSAIRVPMKFWKIVLCVSEDDGGKRERLAYGFIFDQTEAIRRLGFEAMNMESYRIQQVPIAEIARATGVEFDRTVMTADVLRVKPGQESMLASERARSIASLDDVILR